MIKVYKPIHDGCRFITKDDPHEKSDGPTDGIGATVTNEDKGYFCTTCHRQWPCQYEAGRQLKMRVYGKMVRAIASGADPIRVAEAVIFAVQSDDIGYHHDGGDPEGMNLRYVPDTVEGI
jgi:hypothetical protein